MSGIESQVESISLTILETRINQMSVSPEIPGLKELKKDQEVIAAVKAIDHSKFHGFQKVSTDFGDAEVALISSLGRWEIILTNKDGKKREVHVATDDMREALEGKDSEPGGIVDLKPSGDIVVDL